LNAIHAVLLIAKRVERDLDRLAEFLLKAAPEAAIDTTELVIDGLGTLIWHPKIGRKRNDGLRELVISRGKLGYVALYRYHEIRDLVTVLAIRHQREVGQ
jgi:plasmid stabilization system protein ParE